jgi:bacillithiol system protein YtxJ
LNNLRDLSEEGTLADAMAADLALIYKHSHRCPVSRLAMHEVNEFVERRPHVPVYIVNVVRDRALSQLLANDLGVQHQSPQVILLKRGHPEAHASHHKITSNLLETWAGDGT